jgi:hypothetical protein
VRPRARRRGSVRLDVDARRRATGARARAASRMSAVYALEPPTEGKAVVRTTHGELEIEFFAREAPLACRNFVQLALEGCVERAREDARRATDKTTRLTTQVLR